jgi:hypothetical protein
MTNNCRMDEINVGRVQGTVISYAVGSTHVHLGAPYGSLHLDDASLSPLDLCCV